MENWFVPYQTCKLPSASRVLVFAPHPDDEIFGCGGAIALLQQQGAEIEVVVLTDGAGFAEADARQIIINTRQAETNAALAVLSVPPAEFWGMPDRSLVLDAALKQRIDARLQGVDLVLAPSLTEVHPDHAATAKAVLAALQSQTLRGEARPCAMFYEVGTPLMPNCLIDVTAVWALKAQAMRCFESQQANQDYARHIEGLNAFRTYSLDAKVKYAEAYFQIPSDQDQVVLDAESVPSRLHRRTPENVAQILHAAEAQAAQMHRQLARCDKQLAESGRQLSESQAHLAETSQANVQLKVALDQQNQRYEKDVAELRGAIGALEQLHQSLLSSRSWRVTRPLRWLGDLLSRRS